MNILSILIICNIFWITVEFSRLMLLILHGEKPKEFGIFAGLKIFKFELKGIEFRVNMIPLGAYIKYDSERYFLLSGIKRFFLRYYAYLIIGGFVFVIKKYYGDDYVLSKVALVIMVTGGFGLLMNIRTSIKEMAYAKRLER